MRIGELIFCEGACGPNDYSACTASMISRYHLITAAHCVFTVETGK